MRKQIIAGNWKMNKTFREAEDLLADIVEELEPDTPGYPEIIVCPPSVYLELATDIAEESSIKVGAQNINENENGAYTGEISASMLASMNVEYCIIGHSERRKYFNENDKLLSQKIKISLSYYIKPIFCCGEILKERKAKKHFDVVKAQITEALFDLDEESFKHVVVAYEPVWAIGTGVNATPEQAQEMHQYIRQLIADKYGKKIASQTSILYGGSCNSKNAKQLFEKPDVDGGLIGGASLESQEFLKIISSI